MKLDIETEKNNYIDFVSTSARSIVQFLGLADIFLDKILWMDEHFRNLPEGYSSIFEIADSEQAQKVLVLWINHPYFSKLNNAQSGLYGKALSYLCKYKKLQLPEFPNIEDCTQQDANQYIYGSDDSDYEYAYPRTIYSKKSKRSTKCVKEEAPKESPKELPKSNKAKKTKKDSDKVKAQLTSSAINDSKTRTAHLLPKKRDTPATQINRTLEENNGQCIYESLILPNGKSWNEIVSEIRYGQRLNPERPLSVLTLSEYKKLQLCRKHLKHLEKQRAAHQAFLKEYLKRKPLAKIETPSKSAQRNPVLERIEAQIPRRIVPYSLETNFLAWAITSRKISIYRAVDAIHLITVCDEIAMELQISNCQIQTIEDTEELADLISTLESNLPFNKIDRKYHNQLSTSLELYYEFAVSCAEQ